MTRLVDVDFSATVPVPAPAALGAVANDPVILWPGGSGPADDGSGVVGIDAAGNEALIRCEPVDDQTARISLKATVAVDSRGDAFVLKNRLLRRLWVKSVIRQARHDIEISRPAAQTVRYEVMCRLVSGWGLPTRTADALETMRVARDQATGVDATVVLNGLHRVKSVEGRAVRNVRTKLWTIAAGEAGAPEVTEVPADSDSAELPELAAVPESGRSTHALAMRIDGKWRMVATSARRGDLVEYLGKLRDAVAKTGEPLVFTEGERHSPVDAIALHEISSHRVVLYSKGRRQKVPVLVEAPGEPRWERPRAALRDIAFAESLGR